ncbi:NO-binding membrane sensor protein with MHYT domain [Crossiella equi]|uniref:NO-binding membrane sensor protein with MHYT domain n=1 Tax=Crossiella equi TaxID=130796 RepID=A0ABS5A981_9PSEU|nr:hypothetical protein [Crossiella equi]MBP2473137.1 NO-binding membrane sensor protein with MHYT domain [Crossiella equi]
MAERRNRAWWVLGGALVLGGGAWALLWFAGTSWLSDEKNPARPVLEGLSWVAAVLGLLVAAVALWVAIRQGGQPRGGVHNQVTGTVSGTVIQAGDIQGGITLGERDPDTEEPPR